MKKFLLGFLILSTMSCNQDSKTRNLTTKDIPLVFQKDSQVSKVQDHSVKLNLNPFRLIQANVPASEYAPVFNPDCEKLDAQKGLISNPQKIVKDMQYETYEIYQELNSLTYEEHTSTSISDVSSSSIKSEIEYISFLNYFPPFSNPTELFTAKPHRLFDIEYTGDEFSLDLKSQFVNVKPGLEQSMKKESFIAMADRDCNIEIRYKDIKNLLKSSRVDLVSYPITEVKQVNAYVKTTENKSAVAYCLTKASDYKKSVKIGEVDEKIVIVQSPNAIDFERPSLCYNGVLYRSRTVKLKSGEILLSEVRKVLSTPLK